MPKKSKKTNNTAATKAAAAPAGCSWRKVKHRQSWEGVRRPLATNTYSGVLIRFVLHLFDSNKNVITDKYVSKFDAADAYDKGTQQAALRVKLRTEISAAIAEIEPSRDGKPYNVS